MILLSQLQRRTKRHRQNFSKNFRANAEKTVLVFVSFASKPVWIFIDAWRMARLITGQRAPQIRSIRYFICSHLRHQTPSRFFNENNSDSFPSSTVQYDCDFLLFLIPISFPFEYRSSPHKTGVTWLDWT